MSHIEMFYKSVWSKEIKNQTNRNG